jgi:hypothetical protein
MRHFARDEIERFLRDALVEGLFVTCQACR